MYTVTLSKDAADFLGTLQNKDRERIIMALDRAKIRPEHFFMRLVGAELYRMRVGDYRILADIEKQQLRVLIIKIGHRKNIYDGL